MAVPNIFATATSSIPLSQLDTNFATAITLGSTALYLGNTTTSVAGLTITGGAFNGTVGATTPSTGAFTSLSSTIGANFATSSGNVGIGTNAPAAKLDIRGANTLVSVPYSISNIYSTDAFAINKGGSLSFGGKYATDGSVQTFAAIAGRKEDAGDGGWAGYLQFVTGTTPTERMRIDSSGNVGIGTASPAGQLDVYTSSNAAANLAYFRNANAGSSAFAIAAWSNNTTNNAGQIAIASSTNTTYGGGGDFIFLSNTGDMTLRTTTAKPMTFYTNSTERMRIDSAGRVGIGTGATVNYALEVSTDSAGKPGVGGLWTVVSDERIKDKIVPANLDRCYEIVKSVPLKYFGFAPGVYTDDQIQDKHNLGWIAQDVQKVFKNAVSVKPFTLKTDIPDGVEEYEEQDFTLETVEKTETSIQVINGKAVQVSKVVTSEEEILLFDTVDVVDEAGAAVMVDDKPLTYQMPRMITKTRPKVRHDVIEDCLDLNGAQMLAALYGAVQALMEKVETLEKRIAKFEGK